MIFLISRDQYNDLSFFFGYAGIVTTPETRRQILAKHYPAKTGAVVDELCYRGFDADSQSLGNLITTGKISSPANRDPSGYHLWTPAEIDSAAERFTELERFTSETFARMHYRISAYQDEIAKDRLAKLGAVDNFTIIITPPRRVGELARIEYLPPCLTLSRADYERMFHTKEYPKTTGGAAEELRLRNISATTELLNSWVNMGKLPRPKVGKGGRWMRWSREEIDYALGVLLADGREMRYEAMLAAIGIPR